MYQCVWYMLREMKLWKKASATVSRGASAQFTVFSLYKGIILCNVWKEGNSVLSAGCNRYELIWIGAIKIGTVYYDSIKTRLMLRTIIKILHCNIYVGQCCVHKIVFVSCNKMITHTPKVHFATSPQEKA